MSLVDNSFSDLITPLRCRFTYRFSLIASQMTGILLPSLRLHNLTIATWRVLAVIGEYSPLSAKELAKKTSTDQFHVTRALAVLLNNNLIVKDQDLADKRRISLSLTQKGHAICNQIAVELSNLENLILNILSANEKKILFQLLDRLDDQINHKIKESSQKY